MASMTGPDAPEEKPRGELCHRCLGPLPPRASRCPRCGIEIIQTRSLMMVIGTCGLLFLAVVAGLLIYYTRDASPPPPQAPASAVDTSKPLAQQ